MNSSYFVYFIMILVKSGNYSRLTPSVKFPCFNLWDVDGNYR